MSLFGELKRRNVFRVGAAYLVSSWLLIEIADIMFPAFGFPQGALKWLVGALVLGLIPLLLFSWAYELTDHGIVRDQGPDHENPQNAATAHRLDQITIIMILLALAVVVVERFVLPQRVAEPPMAAVETRPAEPAAQAPVEAPPPQPVIETSYTGNFAPEITTLLSMGGWGWHIETAIHFLRLILSAAARLREKSAAGASTVGWLPV